MTPGSPSKFMMAAFVRFCAQKVTAEICPVQPLVITTILTIEKSYSSWCHIAHGM